MDITLGPSPQTAGRFGFVKGEDGDISFDDTEAHAVMTSVMERKNSYWADASHGSEHYKIRNLTSKTPSQSEAVTIDALQSLEDAGSIISPSVASKRATLSNGLGGLSTDIAWTTPGGAAASVKADL